MSNKKILVIDDDEDIQDVALVALEVVGGWEVITAPVIFLTAKVQSGDRDRFARLDIVDVIAKPFKTMSLSQQVSAILGWED